MDVDGVSRSKIRERNYRFFIIEGALFFAGGAFITQDGVVPLFIDHYTGSLQLVGIAATVKLLAGIIAKMLIGPYVTGVKNMPRFTSLVMLTTRPLLLFMIPIFIVVKDPNIIVGFFMFFYTVLWFGQGVTGVAWTDIFGRTMVPSERGKIHGNQQLIGGIAGLIVGVIVKLLLDSSTLSSEQVFGRIFGLCGITMLLSGIVLTNIRDFPRIAERTRKNLLVYYRGLPRYLSKYENYRQMTKVMVVAKVGVLVSPFIILVAKNIHGFSGPGLTSLIYLQIVGGLAGGVMWGQLSHKYGNQHVIVISNALLIVGNAAVCLSIIVSGTGFAVVCIGLGMILSGINAGSWLGYLNYTLDVAGENERVDMMVLHSLILLPTSFIGYFAGVLADRGGYMSVFVIAVLVMVYAYIESLRIKKIR